MITVQDMIDELNKVEDKSRGLVLYASSNNPNIAGVLEVYGTVFDIDQDVFLNDESFNNVVVNAWIDDVELSAGKENNDEDNDKTVNSDEVSDTLDLLEFMLNQYAEESGEKNADKAYEFLKWVRKDNIKRVK